MITCLKPAAKALLIISGSFPTKQGITLNYRFDRDASPRN
jgi:hypothetical protein